MTVNLLSIFVTYIQRKLFLSKELSSGIFSFMVLLTGVFPLHYLFLFCLVIWEIAWGYERHSQDHCTNLLTYLLIFLCFLGFSPSFALGQCIYWNNFCTLFVFILPSDVSLLRGLQRQKKLKRNLKNKIVLGSDGTCL